MKHCNMPVGMLYILCIKHCKASISGHEKQLIFIPAKDCILLRMLESSHVPHRVHDCEFQPDVIPFLLSVVPVRSTEATADHVRTNLSVHTCLASLYSSAVLTNPLLTVNTACCTCSGTTVIAMCSVTA